MLAHLKSVQSRKIYAYENRVPSRKIHAYEKVSEAEKLMHIKKEGRVETDTSTIDAMSKEAKLPFSNSKE